MKLILVANAAILVLFGCKPVEENKSRSNRGGAAQTFNDPCLDPQRANQDVNCQNSNSANQSANQNQFQSPGTNQSNNSTNDNTNSGSQTQPSPASPGSVFGTTEDIDYAAELWLSLRRANLVGPGSVGGSLFAGDPPHGAIREITSHSVAVKGHTGRVFVKKNYGGDGIDIDKVSEDRDNWLKAVTVIFERESGFDPEVNNTFWVKFKANGELDVNDSNTPLAGRIGKGGNAGCIACHSGAQGDDYYFWNDG